MLPLDLPFKTKQSVLIDPQGFIWQIQTISLMKLVRAYFNVILYLVIISNILEQFAAFNKHLWGSSHEPFLLIYK